MKNASPYIVIALLFLSFAGGFYYGRSDLKKELRNSAGLNESKLKESQVRILALKEEIKLREDTLEQIRINRAREQQQHDSKLKQLRSKPPVFVETTTIQIAECDSAKAAGARYREESEVQFLQMRKLEQVVNEQAEKNGQLETSLISVKQELMDSQKSEMECKEDLKSETLSRKRWQKTSIGLGITILVATAAKVIIGF